MFLKWYHKSCIYNRIRDQLLNQWEIVEEVTLFQDRWNSLIHKGKLVEDHNTESELILFVLIPFPWIVMQINYFCFLE